MCDSISARATVMQSVGDTLCLNAGQQNVFLQYLVIDAEFGAAPFPTGLKVTHWPLNQEITVSGD